MRKVVGAGKAQLRTVDGKLNPRRLTEVLYRRPGGTDWEPVSTPIFFHADSTQPRPSVLFLLQRLPRSCWD